MSAEIFLLQLYLSFQLIEQHALLHKNVSADNYLQVYVKPGGIKDLVGKTGRVGWVFMPEDSPFTFAYVVLDGTLPSILKYIDFNNKIIKKGSYCYARFASQKDIQQIQGSELCSELPGTQDISPSITEWRDKVLFNRSLIFEDIMGISENTFRDLVKVGKEELNGKPNVHDVQEWWKVNKNSDLIKERSRNAIEKCKNTFSVELLTSMRASFKPVIENKKSGSFSGTLEILYQDPQKPYNVDIRYLQAAHLGAVFQLASNFNCLEGGLGNYLVNISEMNERPVQGENGCIATAAGVIVRRYFYEAQNLLSEWKDYFYIRGATRGIGEGTPAVQNFHKNNPHILIKDLITTTEQSLPVRDLFRKKHESKPRHPKIQLAGQLKIGIHRSVQVMSCHPVHKKQSVDILIPRNTGQDFPEKSRPAFDYRVEDTRYIHQIFVAAMNLNNKSIFKGVNDYEKNAVAKLVLLGMYEGTILAAYTILKDQKEKQLFLTLVGGSAFGNKIEWIIDVLEELAPLIVATGLRITVVVFRPYQGTSVDKRFAELADLISAFGKSNPDIKNTDFYKWRYNYKLQV